ncbi:putative zinc-binding metallopeptidase [Pseudomonas sp. CCI3.2]|uniref:zinc-binding metallopeptidase family protein n=1 Tax=unclassified Pseudomonas TaxID=196821 RepID=UPI002AC9EDA5|nr:MULTISPECIES: putative zinc-binding metallopeptidase [unclassified Pseudomonas]MEB0078775.1 putative zinc-binding metallopeptidase [Pseudomonas sp. MH10out]MEB0093751.1 putative zinc-binding metallopeptidase [Pseudomonas sp. CCI4.2]MEB0103032.1 putative zinc-binding metallopeptidase [Pseudomonas sp. CCI3.2]MEB0129533.1 putative zinc-binding metallopeptidase [Pseudomonas sp. CCI2.4]MEB0157353.1 putative zinc-binding metallopeptidase [Pseudomonas sp. AH2 (2023)]
MYRFFEQLSSRIAAPFVGETKRNSKVWQCNCGQSIFFANTQCLACSAALGYLPEQGRLVTLEPGQQLNTWRLTDEPQAALYRRCANVDTPAACNWLFPDSEPGEFCIACSLNRTIPDLSIPENAERWCKVETAKRRLVAQLISLGLKVISKSQDEDTGLAFDFVGVDLEGKLPTTGHANGLITLNIEEADDAHREAMRVQLHEPYRTLLGHFRHEVGHYYWDRLIADTHWQDNFRNLFGDDRASYADALEHHYQSGAPVGWQQHYVSAYATMHPWEDWAETWAHYLHMMDAVDTALGFGMSARDMDFDYQPFTLETLYDPQHPGGQAFLSFVNAWIELAGMLNELSRSMGQPDFYPFVLSPAVITKLHFIHLVIQEAGGKADEVLLAQ